MVLILCEYELGVTAAANQLLYDSIGNERTNEIRTNSAHIITVIYNGRN